MMLVFWAVVIIGSVALVRYFNDRGPAARKESDAPLDIIRRRYAAGEITKEQFDEMKRNVA